MNDYWLMISKYQALNLLLLFIMFYFIIQFYFSLKFSSLETPKSVTRPLNPGGD